MVRTHWKSFAAAGIGGATLGALDNAGVITIYDIYAVGGLLTALALLAMGVLLVLKKLGLFVPINERRRLRGRS